MKPKIVVDENLELTDVEEEIEDEDVLESSDDENWDADDDLSVTTKSPTPSPLGSPAEKSSAYGSQEPNELPMPKTPVKDVLPIADGNLISAESPEHSPMVPKRRRIESPRSTEAVSSMNKQNGQSAGCSSPLLGTNSVPAGYTEPSELPMTLTSDMHEFVARWTEARLRLARVYLYMGFPFPAEVSFATKFSEITTNLYQAALLSGLFATVGSNKPNGNPVALEPQNPAAGTSCSVGSREGLSQQATANQPNGSQLTMETEETHEDSIPEKFGEGQFQLAEFPSPVGSLISAGSEKQDEDPGSIELPIRATCISIPVELQEGLSQLNMYAAQIESNVEATPEQIDGSANAVESPITVESSSPTASFHQNGRPMAVRSPTRTEASLPTESGEETESSFPEATLAFPIQSSVSNGSEQVKGLSIVVELPHTVGYGSPAASSKQNGLLMVVESPITTKSTPLSASSIRDKLKNIGLQILFLLSSGSENQTGDPISVGSQIQSTDSAPDLVAIAVKWAEARSRVAQVYSLMGFPIPAGISFETRFADIQSHLYQAALLSGCFDQVGSNGTSVVLEPPNPAGTLEGLSQQAFATSPIQSSVPNGSEQVNETSFPAGILEVGSKKSNGGPAAIGSLILARSRKRLTQQDTISPEYEKSDKQSMAVDAAIPVGPKLVKVESTEPNKIPTAAGSAFSYVRSFSNAIFGGWKKVQSCVVQFSSMMVFVPNGNSAPSPLATAEAVSAPLPKPQPPENVPESIDMEVGEDDY